MKKVKKAKSIKKIETRAITYGPMNSTHTARAMKYLKAGKTSSEVFDIISNYKGAPKSLTSRTIANLKGYMTSHKML